VTPVRVQSAEHGAGCSRERNWVRLLPCVTTMMRQSSSTGASERRHPSEGDEEQLHHDHHVNVHDVSTTTATGIQRQPVPSPTSSSHPSKWFVHLILFLVVGVACGGGTVVGKIGTPTVARLITLASTTVPHHFTQLHASRPLRVLTFVLYVLAYLSPSHADSHSLAR
jgi:hypothetical protein